MFQQTRIRLTLLNALVFLLILGCFGGSLYLYMKQRLFEQVDASLIQNKEHIVAMLQLQSGEYSIIIRQRTPYGTSNLIIDPRIGYFYWDREGNPVQIPAHLLPRDAEFQYPEMNENTIRTIRIGGYHYRTLTIPIHHQYSNISTIQLIRNVDSEISMLDSLLKVIVAGWLLGGGITILVGLYLAQKALIPIKQSWEKQQQFVADASHELRTPLAVLRNSAELLLRNPQQTIEEKASTIHNILKESRRMNKLVADLLTLARSDSNQAELQKSEFRLDEAITEVIQIYREVGQLKGHRFEEFIDQEIIIDADMDRIHQLLVILLDNAVKYTPENGLIQVYCTKSSQQIELIIKDTGIGISAEDLPHIFERFYRGDKVRSRQEGGTGLGLAIAEWIVKKHDGKIRLESQPGHGTTVYVTLPAKS